MNVILPSDLKKRKDLTIIDIRDSVKYNNGHIDGAKNIPYLELINNYEKYLDRNNNYCFYCSRGIKSHKLCVYLDSKGYNVFNLAGGYETWILDN